MQTVRQKREANFTWESKILLKYYEYFCVLNIPPSSQNKKSLFVKNGIANGWHIFTRSIWLTKELYLILLYLNYFERIHGPLDLFDHLELVLFFTAFLTILGFEVLCRSKDLINSIHPILNFWSSMWKSFAIAYKIKEAGKLRKSLLFSITFLLFHFV